MNQAQILDYAQTCLVLVLRLSLIPILVATVIGVIVSLLQALTQIQEQTLGFAVKLIAISVTLLACASWMASSACWTARTASVMTGVKASVRSARSTSSRRQVRTRRVPTLR